MSENIGAWQGKPQPIRAEVRDTHTEYGEGAGLGESADTRDHPLKWTKEVCVYMKTKFGARYAKSK